MKRSLVLLLLSVIGFFDAFYLTYEHYSDRLPPCIAGAFVDCGQVLKSSYAMVGPIPLALIGVVYYFVLFLFAAWYFVSKSQVSRYVLVAQTFGGFFASLYFVYLQIAVIHAICLYCMVSAVTSTLIFILAQSLFPDERKRLTIWFMHVVYAKVVKPVLFLFDPEQVHVFITGMGELGGKVGLLQQFGRFFVHKNHSMLAQDVAGIHFNGPIGLSAGFDYEARLTQSLSAWGFGFQSVGTITNMSYEGNERPMLGRLPKSRALMVNKGFKNPGADKIIEKLEKLRFEIPVGISIGRTNSKSMVTQSESVADIVACFKKFEASKVAHAYYELNISCPNLHGNVSFYPVENLEELLAAVDGLDVQRPIFVKMPIEKSDAEVLAMLEVIAKHKVSGVIFGNLQKDRNHPSLDQEEVRKFDRGNFSGKPTHDRSNELISLAYKHFASRFIIIGCGGIFSAEDAFEKITRGATLLQMITGMIYEGPEVVSEINFGLVDLLKKHNFRDISQAIGSRKENLL